MASVRDDARPVRWEALGGVGPPPGGRTEEWCEEIPRTTVGKLAHLVRGCAPPQGHCGVGARVPGQHDVPRRERREDPARLRPARRGHVRRRDPVPPGRKAPVVWAVIPEISAVLVAIPLRDLELLFFSCLPVCLCHAG